VLQVGRLIVPFEEVAHGRGGIDGGVRPFAARRALVGLDDVADHDVDRHAIAPGIVERHRGVLQADHAMAHHGQRPAIGVEQGLVIPVEQLPSPDGSHTSRRSILSSLIYRAVPKSCPRSLAG
jgi:hypothetical protein